MIDTPTKITDIDKLITDKTPEDLHLDYKDSAALDKNNRHEISKDISSFANSDGGIIIYGIAEKDNFPLVGDVGVDHTKFSRETLENIISSNISPRIDGIRIFPIPISETTSIYVVEIPRSDRAPHQAKDKKYYKRFNFKSEAMEDYEINDVRNRQIAVLPLMNISAETKDFFVYIKVSNVGSLPAVNVSFSLSEPILWDSNRGIPSLFKNGTKYFPANKTSYFLWNTIRKLFHQEDSNLRKIDATVTYLHPQTNKYISDIFHIDLEDFRDGITPRSETRELKDFLKEGLSKLTDEIKKLNRSIEPLVTIAGDSGLDLSITTLRNLRNIHLGDGNLEKINPNYCNYKLFQEVLNIDDELAYNLELYFMHFRESKRLEDVEGITPEIIDEVKKCFKVEE